MAADANRVKEIFMAVSEVAAENRTAYLDRECRNDEEVRRRVEALLQAHDQPADFLQQPRSGVTGEFVQTLRLNVGQTIAGKYKLREKLGEGGMGSVWVADQSEPVQRRVAIKLIKSGSDRRSMLARFEQERQALALMDHPNIAKVFDAGVDEDYGLPYFVMELIKGVPLTKYCDSAKLSPQQRLELFVPVCQAVQHAHQKGIIHRDLKPSNILVGLYDGKPVPKVIDFGVAKATGARLTDESIYTEVGSLVGTLEYMSPEQAELNNLDIDTRTDIYALGVILYELLTGSVPFSRMELTKAGFGEMLRVIKEVEPPKPSTKLSRSGMLPNIAADRHTEPAKLTKLMQGELDWIVMKALEKDRSRRYETANGFAMDVQRYLAGEHVLAVPPSAGYRLRKFARKHRAALTTAAVIAMLLVAGVVVSAWQAIRATRAETLATAERDRAEANFRQARAAVDEYFTAVSDNQLLNAPGMQPLRKDLLDRALRYYQGFARDREKDPTVRAELAAANYKVAWITEILGSKDQAVESYRHAIGIYDQLAAEYPTQVRYQIDRAMVFNELGNLLRNMGNPSEALDAHNQALAIRQVLAAAHPTEGRYQNELAKSHNNIGNILFDTARLEESLIELEKSRVINERWAQAPPANLAQFPTDLGRHFNKPQGIKLDLALNNRQIGGVLYRLGRNQEALRAYERARSTFEALVRENPDDLDFPSHLADILMRIAFVHGLRGRTDEATEICFRALDIMEPLAGKNPDVRNSQRQLAMVHRDLGRQMRRQKQFPKAREHLEKARANLEKLAQIDPSDEGLAMSLAYVFREFGWIDREEGLAAPALRLFEKARDIDDRYSRTSVGACYDLACDWAVCIPLIGWGKTAATLTPDERAERQRLGNEAIKALRRAIDGGWRNFAHMTKDEDLDPLRDRDDFKKLLAELEKK